MNDIHIYITSESASCVRARHGTDAQSVHEAREPERDYGEWRQ